MVCAAPDECRKAYFRKTAGALDFEPDPAWYANFCASRAFAPHGVQRFDITLTGDHIVAPWWLPEELDNGSRQHLRGLDLPIGLAAGDTAAINGIARQYCTEQILVVKEEHLAACTADIEVAVVALFDDPDLKGLASFPADEAWW